MNKIANAGINTFGTTAPKADFVSEQLITLTLGQLQDIVAQAVEKAIQPLQARVSALEAAQETLAENQLIQLRLINDLRESRKEAKPPTANQENRIHDPR